MVATEMNAKTHKFSHLRLEMSNLTRFRVEASKAPHGGFALPRGARRDASVVLPSRVVI